VRGVERCRSATLPNPSSPRERGGIRFLVERAAIEAGRIVQETLRRPLRPGGSGERSAPRPPSWSSATRSHHALASRDVAVEARQGALILTQS
jgi:hypothetical protein